jgi:copper resistance protein B
MRATIPGLAAAGLAVVLTGCQAIRPVRPAAAPYASDPSPGAHDAATPQHDIMQTQGVPRSSLRSAFVQEDGGLAEAGRGDAARVVQSGWPAPVHDDQFFTFLRAEQLEYRVRDGSPDVVRWEAQGWHGGDYQKLWIKTEGEESAQGASEGEVEVQALYSRVVAPFWDLQIGARYDSRWGSGPDEDRGFGVLGVQGFSPYEFEVEAALFVSEDADVSARLTATTDFLITQRLILQPRFETEVAAHEVQEFQVGKGLNYVDVGLRLRYEIRRWFAPYIGVNWIRSISDTKDLVRGAGGDANDLALVLGISIWF